MKIDDYAKLIFKQQPILVLKDSKYEDKMNDLVEGIMSRDQSRHGRSYEEVFAACKKAVPEIALTLMNNDFILNPLKHDKTNPHSYAYDCIYTPTNETFEVKTWNADQPNGKLADWFSYPEHAMNTFRKNLSIIDYILGAKTVEQADHFLVYFLMIADAKSFFKYTKKSMYKPDDLLYYHNNAMRDGMCLRNMQVNYDGAKYVRTSFGASAA
jgi:hypothetical protein